MSTLHPALLGSLVVLALGGCGSGGRSAPDAPLSPTDITAEACTTGASAKLQFEQTTGCGNDGSVEFCIPDADAAVLASVQAISTTIRCAPGGGRARCTASPNLLLCFYPTTFPDECVADRGAMTAGAWDDMCRLTSLPEVAEIVHTIFE